MDRPGSGDRHDMTSPSASGGGPAHHHGTRLHRPGTALRPPCPDHAGRPSDRRRRWLAALAWLLTAAVLFACYLHVSRTQPVNSDGAANALQAWDMLHGNLLLHDWWLSDVSFYTTELPRVHAGGTGARAERRRRARGRGDSPTRCSSCWPRCWPRAAPPAARPSVRMLLAGGHHAGAAARRRRLRSCCCHRTTSAAPCRSCSSGCCWTGHRAAGRCRCS